MMKAFILISLAIIVVSAGERRRLIGNVPKNPRPSIPLSSRLEMLAGIFPGNDTSIPGYIDFSSEDGTSFHFFYWMFEARDVPAKDAPLVFWFTGGPGCSSVLALFVENGPWHFSNPKDQSTIYVNPWSWNQKANLIFVDQPVFTGFSYADKQVFERNEDEVAADMIKFFTGFYQKYPQYAKNDMWITGESYGGHYVPAISHAVVEHGGFPFRGLAIGNGLVDALYQYPEYGPFAYANKLVGKGTVDVAKVEMVACAALLKAGAYGLAFVPCNAVMSTVLTAAGNINVYNVKEQCTYPPLCYDFGGVTNFLNNATVQQAIGVPSGIQWSDCNFNVNGEFHKDWMTPMSGRLTNVLAGNFTVLTYNGMLDFICNWMGNEAWVNHYSPAIAKAQYQQVNLRLSNGTMYNSGEWKVANNFAFYKVRGAGHMCPMDKPEVSLMMINKLISGGWRE